MIFMIIAAADDAACLPLFRHAATPRFAAAIALLFAADFDCLPALLFISRRFRCLLSRF